MGIIVVWDGSLSQSCSHQHWAITCPPRGVDKNTRWESTLQCQVMAGRLQQAHIKQKRPQQRRGEYRSLPAHTSHSKQTVPQFQTGTLGFVSLLTYERNQSPSPSPHYSGQPSWSNSMTKNINCLWQCMCMYVCGGNTRCMSFSHSTRIITHNTQMWIILWGWSDLFNFTSTLNLCQFFILRWSVWHFPGKYKTRSQILQLL